MHISLRLNLIISFVIVLIGIVVFENGKIDATKYIKLLLRW